MCLWSWAWAVLAVFARGAAAQVEFDTRLPMFAVTMDEGCPVLLPAATRLVPITGPGVYLRGDVAVVAHSMMGTKRLMQLDSLSAAIAPEADTNPSPGSQGTAASPGYVYGSGLVYALPQPTPRITIDIAPRDAQSVVAYPLPNTTAAFCARALGAASNVTYTFVFGDGAAATVVEAPEEYACATHVFRGTGGTVVVVARLNATHQGSLVLASEAVRGTPRSCARAASTESARDNGAARGMRLGVLLFMPLLAALGGSLMCWCACGPLRARFEEPDHLSFPVEEHSNFRSRQLSASSGSASSEHLLHGLLAFQSFSLTEPDSSSPLILSAKPSASPPALPEL